MTTRLDKGSTFYDHQLIERMEEFPTPLRDLHERSMDDAAEYLANRLRDMPQFKMNQEIARHHVYRLYQQADY